MIQLKISAAELQQLKETVVNFEVILDALHSSNEVELLINSDPEETSMKPKNTINDVPG